jgi:hypothetical protein
MTNKDLVVPNLDRGIDSFNARIKRHEFNWASGTERLKGDFFYLPFRDKRLTTDEFIKYIVGEAINYALPYSQRKEATAQTTPRDFTAVNNLKQQMKDLFTANTGTSGEFGELIMYIILRDFLNAPQIVNKMALKTSGNMPVHGSDGVHIGFDGKTMIFYYGESKVYSQNTPTTAIEDALESSKKLLTNAPLPNGAKAKDFEVDLISRHFSLPECDDEQKKAILAYLNPLATQYNDSKDVAVCFIGFDLAFYKKLDSSTDVEALFSSEYETRIKAAIKTFSDKVSEKKLHDFNFHFLLLPFKSITDFRKEFLEKLDEY